MADRSRRIQSRAAALPTSLLAAAAMVVAALTICLAHAPLAWALVPLPDYNEPNDSFETATRLASGEPGWGAIGGAADTDHFYLDISAPGAVHVEFVAGVPGRTCDLFFQAAGSGTKTALRWARTPDGEGGFSSVGVVVPGRFFAVIGGAGTGPSTVAYTITVTYIGGGGGSDFTDVPQGSPFYPAINYLASEQVVSGYGDGRFGLEDPVRRQQFAKMIVRAADYPVSTIDICEFVDVQTSYPGFYIDPNDILYPDHYIAVAAKHGITVGKTPYTFEPYRDIMLAQVITMVVRAGEDLGVYDSPPRSYVPPFADFGEPHYLYAREGAAHGLFEGYPGPWDWHAPATRGQCAFFIWKLMLRLRPGVPAPQL